jgi:hypothetical protein
VPEASSSASAVTAASNRAGHDFSVLRIGGSLLPREPLMAAHLANIKMAWRRLCARCRNTEGYIVA